MYKKIIEGQELVDYIDKCAATAFVDHRISVEDIKYGVVYVMPEREEVLTIYLDKEPTIQNILNEKVIEMNNYDRVKEFISEKAGFSVIDEFKERALNVGFEEITDYKCIAFLKGKLLDDFNERISKYDLNKYTENKNKLVMKVIVSIDKGHYVYNLYRNEEMLAGGTNSVRNFNEFKKFRNWINDLNKYDEGKVFEDRLNLTGFEKVDDLNEYNKVNIKHLNHHIKLIDKAIGYLDSKVNEKRISELKEIKKGILREINQFRIKDKTRNVFLER